MAGSMTYAMIGACVWLADLNYEACNYYWSLVTKKSLSTSMAKIIESVIYAMMLICVSRNDLRSVYPNVISNEKWLLIRYVDLRSEIYKIL